MEMKFNKIKKERIKTVDWQLTSDCNYNCSYCPIKIKERVGKIIFDCPYATNCNNPPGIYIYN